MAEDKTNSPDELLDLVDENDTVIGTVLKSEANQNPKLIHREVGGILYDNKNRVLLQQRSLKKKTNPGVWTNSWCGHVPREETPEQAAYRELKEELGLDVKLDFIAKRLTKRPEETHYTYLYLGLYTGEPIYPNQDEVAKVRFFSEAEFTLFRKENDIPENFALKEVFNFWAGEFDRFK